jgi:hypothetical protein
MGAYVISDKSTYPVAAGADIKARDQIYIDENGFAAPGAAPVADLTGTVLGSAIEDVDNSTGDDGDLTVTVEHSLGQKAFLLATSDIVAGDEGKTCYVGATPKTVSLTSTNAITAGKIQGVESDGRVRVVFPL